MRKPKVIVYMPAFNTEKTLQKTVSEIPKGQVDEIILVDNKSSDNTVRLARELGLEVFCHKENRGYGGTQKTGYKKALERGADIVVMLHSDYQYDPRRLGELIQPIINGKADIMFGSRIRTKKETLEGGMPYLKYVINRLYCIIQNFVLGVGFSEFFSGYRAYSKEVLTTLPIEQFSDDYVFDQELMISAIAYGYRIGEIPVAVRYFSGASSIKFFRGSKFLWQSNAALLLYLLFKFKIYRSPIFKYKVT